MAAITVGGAVDLSAATPGEGGIRIPIVAGVGDLAWNIRKGQPPELVPADVLTAAAEDWIGKPIVLDHPKLGYVTPRDYYHGIGSIKSDTPVVGRVVAMEGRDGKLAGEALIEDARVARTPKLQAVLESGKRLNVSIGTRAVIDHDARGSDGQRDYAGKWSRITKRDHIALLTSGRGACNTNMGAGFARAASEGEPVNEDELKTALAGMEPDALKKLLTEAQLTGLAPAPAAPTADPPDEPKNASEDATAAITAAITAGLEPISKRLDAIEKQGSTVERMAAEQKAKDDADRKGLVEKLVNCKAYTADEKAATDDCPHTDTLAETPLPDLRERVRLASRSVTPFGQRFPASNVGAREGSKTTGNLKFATRMRDLLPQKEATNGS